MTPHAWVDDDEPELTLPRHRRQAYPRVGNHRPSPHRIKPQFKGRSSGRPQPAKACVIQFKGVDCGWNPEKKILVIGAKPPMVFLSHAKALKARWHTIQNINASGLTQPGGLPFHSDDFVLVDV